MIRFGPAGIPLSCKGRTVLEGIVDTSEMGRKETGKGLDAMEVQLLRSEVGDAKEIRKMARQKGVKLSAHTPYYLDLCGKRESSEFSKKRIKESLRMAEEIGADVLVTHLGLYKTSCIGALLRKQSLENVVKNVRRVRDWARKKGLKVKLGLEPSGKKRAFGAWEEILTVCRRVKHTLPILNFAHIHARGNGSLCKQDDFAQIFKEAEKWANGEFYIHFSGVAYDRGDEKYLTPIKKGDLRFEEMAKCMREGDFDGRIISSSPLLEHDAVYMRIIWERVKVGSKK